MNGFAAVLAASVLVVAGLVLMHGVAHLLGRPGAATNALPYTGGVPPPQHAVSRFHIRWYPVAMLFLAFDMEMIFMYPWTLVITTAGTSAVVEMFGFLAVLLVGVVYAWREGALRWT